MFPPQLAFLTNIEEKVTEENMCHIQAAFFSTPAIFKQCDKFIYLGLTNYTNITCCE